MGIDAIRGLFEPSCDFSQIEGLEGIRVEAGEAQVPALGTPDAQLRRRNQERAAIGIEGEERVVGLLGES